MHNLEERENEGCQVTIEREKRKSQRVVVALNPET
jgi:hypothetical protein